MNRPDTYPELNANKPLGDSKMDPLPPIHYSSQPLVPLGKNPFPNIRVVADYGSIGSIQELTDQGTHQQIPKNSETSLSLTVCKHCQDVLLGAFNHCLGKQGEAIPLLSTHHIDEESDAKILVPAPLFDIVKDPTSSTSKKLAFEDALEKTERDRWVNEQTKTFNKKLDINTPRLKGLGVKPGKAFSGAIYKRMLEAKDREINQLRTQIYDLSRRESLESSNLKKLKKALNQSVHYYTFAEEWQQNESARLQHDVKTLKSEISSLMAFLINSEVEKQTLVAEMRNLETTFAGRERDAAKAINQAEEMKGKLQESFKEFIAMDNAMEVLRNEAIKGSEAVEMRNNMLQKNLTKLTTDFESSNKELRAASTKVREYEYELEQMTLDLNTKSDALSKSSNLASNLKETLDTTTIELKDLREVHEQLILAKAKVEAEGRAETAKFEGQRQEFKKKLLKMNQDLDFISEVKTDLDSQVRVMKNESDVIKKQISELISTRDKLSNMYEESQSHGKKEISRRDETILDLTSRVNKAEALIATISERREQLMFEVTDLKNALDNETNNAAKFLDELNHLKKTTDEKINMLNEQIEKLSSSKQILATDKKELTEKVKMLRSQNERKQEEMERNHREWDEKYRAQSGILRTTTNALENLTEKHNTLTDNFNTLTVRHANSTAECAGLVSTLEAANKKQMVTDAELLSAKNNILQLQKDKTGLQWDMANAKNMHDSLNIKFNVECNQHQLAVETHENYKARAEEIILCREQEIQRLCDELVVLRLENKNVKEKLVELENLVGNTEKKLQDAIKAYIKENQTKEMLEVQLNDNRILYQNEKRNLVELERVAAKLKYVEATRETGHLQYWKTRDRKLLNVTIGLDNEAKRLANLVSLLPNDENGGFGNEEQFVIPSDCK